MNAEKSKRCNTSCAAPATCIGRRPKDTDSSAFIGVHRRLIAFSGIKRTALAFAAGSVIAAAPDGALAQAYPNKPVRLLVPFPAGAGVDIVARMIGLPLAEVWGQAVVVDNRPGAGGRTRAVNRVPACGM